MLGLPEIISYVYVWSVEPIFYDQIFYQTLNFLKMVKDWELVFYIFL